METTTNHHKPPQASGGDGHQGLLTHRKTPFFKKKSLDCGGSSSLASQGNSGAESWAEERSHLKSALSLTMPKSWHHSRGHEPADGRVLSRRAALPKIQVTEPLYPSNCCCQDSYLKKPRHAAPKGQSLCAIYLRYGNADGREGAFCFTYL